MVSKEQLNAALARQGLKSVGQANIRDIQTLSKALEKETGEPFIHLEMGVPGLKPSDIAFEAEMEALRNGCAAVYPPNSGIERLHQAASKFVKAFIDIDVNPAHFCATTGSMQGTFAVMMTMRHANPDKDTVLFIDPGFNVQKTQAQIIGLKGEHFDVHHCRGQQLLDRMESVLQKGRTCLIVYSNPNNPAWICLSDEELRGIGALATQYDVVVLEDLAYFAMDFRKDLSKPYEAPFQPTVAKYTGNYVMAISGSKAFSYAGQRIGALAISDSLYEREYEPLEAFGVKAWGDFLGGRVLYTMSSGTAHAPQHALAAMMEAAVEGRFDFVAEIREYGRRARFMKEVLLRNGFYLVYDNDLGAPLADGFYFTTQYPGMTDIELTGELMRYGIAVFPLESMGSDEQGVRICTSFITDAQFPLFEERIAAFAADHR